jgi:hypothetical protein
MPRIQFVPNHRAPQLSAAHGGASVPLRKLEDTKLRSKIVRVLLELVALGGLWGRKGPSQRLIRHCRAARGTMKSLTRREDTVVRVAMDVWNGSGGARFEDVLALPEEELVCIGFLMFAAGQNFEEWVGEVKDHLLAMKRIRRFNAHPGHRTKLQRPSLSAQPKLGRTSRRRKG